MRRVTRRRDLPFVSLARMVIVSALVFTMVTPAAAENPIDVVDDLADDGIYIAPGRADEAEAEMFLAVIEDASTRGVSMAMLWPATPQPNTGAFARRVQEATMLDVVLVYGPDGDFGSFVSEDFEDGSIRASSAARAESAPVAQAEAFLVGLLEEPVRERPAIIDDLVRWVVLLVAALVIAAVGEQMIRQFKRFRKRKRFEQQQSA